MPDRFPPPWFVVPREDCFSVVDSNGFALAYVYFRKQTSIGTNLDMMTKDQARRVAMNIAKLPALLMADR